MRAATFLTCALLAAALPAPAQDDPHAACAATGWVPREMLERTVPLRPGLGNASERVTTASAEAQKFYLQGLDYLHGYVWIEAARSFNQALRADPALAMAWVGLSRVYSGLDDPQAARAAVERAQALGAQASEKERRRIAIRARQLDAIEDLGSAAKHAEYKKAIDDALAQDLSDVELWLLRGNAEEPTAAGRGQRGSLASTLFYREALRVAPDNAAAHHYLTHSYETMGAAHIPAALEEGEAYARLAPAVPHSHHMWGHDLRRVGRIDDAIAAFEKTDALEKAYYAAEKIPAGLDWHHVHNLDLLATAYQHKGQMKKAEATLQEADALAAVTEYQEYNQKALPIFLIGRGRWEDALTSLRRFQASQWPSVRVVGHTLAGHALLALGRNADARQALAEAEKEMAAVPTLAGGLAVSRGAVLPYVDTLRGELMLREGRADEGRALLKDVQKRLRALFGPDAWIQSLFRLESIARTARDVGDWELAEYTAAQMLDHDAAYGGSHLAMALVARHKGDATGAARSMAAAARYWRDADADLPELAQVRQARLTSR
jgi:tetratricopeptide (TPR) repeat protein